MRQLFYYTLHSGERLPDDGLPGDKNNVKPGVKSGVKQTNGFSQQPSQPVSSDCIAQALASDEPIAVVQQPIGGNTQQHPTMVMSAAHPTQAREVFVTAKPEAPLHPASLRFPVHLLHMITPHGQDMTPALAATFQYLTPASRCHASAETMNTLATANLGLPGSFWHRKCTSLTNIYHALS